MKAAAINVRIEDEARSLGNFTIRPSALVITVWTELQLMHPTFPAFPKKCIDHEMPLSHEARLQSVVRIVEKSALVKRNSSAIHKIVQVANVGAPRADSKDLNLPCVEATADQITMESVKELV